jgi:hypothetical protein
MSKIFKEYMSSYITKLVGYFSTSKTFVQDVADKVATKAKRSGKSFKEYIHDNENVSHISLVVYDVLPLPLKFAIRYENFNKKFTNNFAFIREKLFDAPVKEAERLTETINASKPAVKKAPAKKAPTKKVAAKKVVKEVESGKAKPASHKIELDLPTVPVKKIAKKTPAKKVAAKKVVPAKTVKKVK